MTSNSRYSFRNSTYNPTFDIVLLRFRANGNAFLADVAGNQDSNLTATLDEEGDFIFTHVLKDQPLFSIQIELSGYQSKSISGTADLFTEEWNVGEIHLFRETGTLSGMALKEGSNDGGVRVEVGTEFVTYSDPSGAWSLQNIPTGQVSVSFSAPQFNAQLSVEMRSTKRD